MALNPSGAISLAGPSAGQSIALEVGQSATAQISLNDTNVRTLAGVPSGQIVMPTDFWGKSSFTATTKAIFAFGQRSPNATVTNVSNLVSNAGVVATDTPGVGTARGYAQGATYGGDKAIMAFGGIFGGATFNVSNLISNTGVVSTDSPGVGTARTQTGALGYGGNKAIYGFGVVSPSTQQNVSNLVSSSGVVASDTPGVGTARSFLAAVTYGYDKGLFGFGFSPVYSPAPGLSTNTINYVSNTGVVASDTPGVGTVRYGLSASSYGNDKAIFAYGRNSSTTINFRNLVSNTGVVASDTPGVGTARTGVSGAGYGGDKGIFGFGQTTPPSTLRNMTNLVSNTGVIASDTPGVGTARQGPGAAGYSTT